MASFIEQLIRKRKDDIQTLSSRALEKSIGGAKSKEKGWRSLSNFIKTGFKFIDPTGGVLGAGVDALIDPIGRGIFGQGAKSSDINLADLRFGGKRALEQSREGLEESISDYSKGQIGDALLGFGASKVGGHLLDKAPKWNWLNQAFGGEAGDKGAEAVSKVGEKAGADKKFGGWLDGFLSKMGQESQVAGSGGGSGSKTSPFDVGAWDFEQGGQIQKYKQGGIIQKFIDGGMVKKYEEGGSIEGNILRGTGQTKAVKVNARRHSYKDVQGHTNYQQIWDIKIMEWDGSSWVNKGITKPIAEKQPGRTTVIYNMKPVHTASKQTSGYETMEGLDAYRTAEGTEAIAEQYMEGEGAGTGGIGVTEFKRNQDMADLMNRAKGGDEQALKDIAEVIRQTRPDLATKTDAELIPDLKTGLYDIDLQGEDYEKLVEKKETALRGEQEAYKTGLGQLDVGATKLAGLGQQVGGMGTSQRQMRKGAGALSQGMSDLFGGYQAKTGDIRSGFASDSTAHIDEQFDPFESIVMGIDV